MIIAAMQESINGLSQGSVKRNTKERRERQNAIRV